jgi:hypothetical protein
VEVGVQRPPLQQRQAEPAQIVEERGRDAGQLRPEVLDRGGVAGELPADGVGEHLALVPPGVLPKGI